MPVGVLLSIGCSWCFDITDYTFFGVQLLSFRRGQWN